MAGQNWYSKTRSWSDLVNKETKDKAKEAVRLRKSGKSVKEIAKTLDLSESRIYEYLRTK
jgi:DNA-binding NarL/FixJ family response regulator